VAYDGRHGVKVNDYLQTTNPRIYAAGDVCMEAKFTHAADFAARTVIQNALFLGRKRLSALTIPWCTYTDPEIAHVGLSGAQAEERGLAVDTLVRPLLGGGSRRSVDGEEQGFVKVHLRRGTDKIVGATIVARHAGEMIGELTLALRRAHRDGPPRLGHSSLSDAGRRPSARSATCTTAPASPPP
jgi:pyruvate/2-oxoglutarate dehydrogenase complex dihydrolipoamide dehydrogenase (E3) component